MIRAVGFDLDNTLYDQEQHVFPFFADAARYLAEQTSLDPGALEYGFRALWRKLGPSHPALFDHALEQQGIRTRDRVRKLVNMYHSTVGVLELYTGARELLESLARRTKLFLITDGDAAMQLRKIRSLGIASFFAAAILTGAHGRGWRKPSTAPFLHAAKSLQVAPELCLYVGDNPACDFGGAAAIGMRTARVLTGPFSAAEDSVRVDYTLRSLAELDALV